MEPSWAQNFDTEAASIFTSKLVEAFLQISLAYWFSELQVLKTQMLKTQTLQSQSSLASFIPLLHSHSLQQTSLLFLF